MPHVPDCLATGSRLLATCLNSGDAVPVIFEGVPPLVLVVWFRSLPPFQARRRIRFLTPNGPFACVASSVCVACPEHSVGPPHHSRRGRCAYDRPVLRHSLYLTLLYSTKCAARTSCARSSLNALRRRPSRQGATLILDTLTGSSKSCNIRSKNDNIKNGELFERIFTICKQLRFNRRA